MKIGDILYFSPRYKFLDLKWDNKNILIDAFEDRVKGFYIEPAKKLNEDKKGFATGILCVTTIDFLARIATDTNGVRKRIVEWLETNVKEFSENDPDNQKQTLANRFYEEFRNGLVHEGRIKNAGQFSYDFEKLVNVMNGVMVVNPRCLINVIETSFKNYVDKIKKEESALRQLRCALISVQCHNFCPFC
jgi:hypothetical protein